MIIDTISFDAACPYGIIETFPDNGLLTFDYDKRVSQNDMAHIGRELLGECEAYYREEALNGTGIYTWNPDFIKMVQQSINDNKMANFSKSQKILFKKYITLLTDGIVGNEPEEVIELNKYLGGL